MWVLGLKCGSSTRTASALNHRAISLAPYQHFLKKMGSRTAQAALELLLLYLPSAGFAGEHLHAQHQQGFSSEACQA